MYYYILDPTNIPLEKFERLQTEISGLLAEFKISGEMARVTPLRSIGDLVDVASQRGTKTLIACGTDDTFNLMLAALKGRDFTLGFIPLVEDSYLATILGVPNVYTGVKTVAARRIEKIDLAKVAGNYFISYLEFGVLSQDIKSASWLSGLRLLSGESKNITVRVDDSYNVTIDCLGGLVVNIRSSSQQSKSIANPTDGFLDLLLVEKLSRLEILRYRKDIADGCLENVPNTTVIKCRKLDFLEPKGYNLTMLGRVVTKFPAQVEIIPQRSRMIVGRNRTF